jgi:hypothetical protein
MAQVVSDRPLTAEVRVCSRVNTCGICGQSGTGTGFFPVKYHLAVALHTHISSEGRTVGPLVAGFETVSSIAMNNRNNC